MFNYLTQYTSCYIPVNTNLEVIACPEVNGNKGQPYNTGCVHREANKLALVEIFWNFSRLDGVHRTCGDQEHIIDEGNEKR